MAQSRSLPHDLVERAHAVLLSANGLPNTELGRRIGLSHVMVGHWRRRFHTDPLAVLYDAPRSGRPQTQDEDEVACLLRTVLQARPADATHWSVRSVATNTGISKRTVQRYFALFGVQPHRTKSFKLSTGPFLVEKVRDVVGLHVNPPDHAVALAVDEKIHMQALERSAAVLPMGLGYVEGVTHDYVRHGTTTLFAALDIQTGDFIADGKPRHRHQEYLPFLQQLDRTLPARLDVHPILDTYATHKHAKIRALLACHPRFLAHFTPTYASWLNQVERWFGLVTQQAIRRSRSGADASRRASSPRRQASPRGRHRRIHEP